MHHYIGHCSCRLSTIRLETPFPIVGEDLRSCGCDFCVERGGIYFSAPDSFAKITALRLEETRQGSRTASMLTCGSCGELLAATCEIDGQLLGAVCAERFQELEEVSPKIQVDAGELAKSKKIARWRSLWMPIKLTVVP